MKTIGIDEMDVLTVSAADRLSMNFCCSADDVRSCGALGVEILYREPDHHMAVLVRSIPIH